MMFQRVIRSDGDGRGEMEESLDGDVLEVLRAGMKTKWPEHFSMEGPAGICIQLDSSRGLPTTGFTFMVRRSSLSLLRI